MQRSTWHKVFSTFSCMIHSPPTQNYDFYGFSLKTRLLKKSGFRTFTVMKKIAETFVLVSVHVVLQRSRVRLSQPVNVNNGAMVVQLVESGKVHRLPHVALHRLSVSHQAVGPVRGFVEDLAAVGHAAGDAKALTEGAGGNIDKVETGGGVTLQVRVHSSKFKLQTKVAF